MFTLSQVWRKYLGLSPTRRQGRRSTARPWLEVLEDRAVLSAVTATPAPPATTSGHSANSSPTSNAVVLASQTPAQITLENGVTTAFFLAPASLNGAINYSPSTNAGLVQNQSAQSASYFAPTVFPFFAVRYVLGSGVVSPGVPFGFTGRIAFSNTGTPERTANGVGALAPNSGVTPTGLYLTSGGGDNGLIGPPPRPAPAAALPGGMSLLDDFPDTAPPEPALVNLVPTP